MEKIICVVGPTASGKTGLSIRLAQALGGEVLSCDSMQIYQGMDIGTAKVTPAEMQGVQHHMLDLIQPSEDYSVSRFVTEAEPILQDILRRGKYAILTGGTGLYIDSLVAGRTFAPYPATGKRQELEALAARKGIGAVIALLEQFDPDSARRLHPSDQKRIIRAAEVYLETGQTITAHNARTRALPPRHEALWLGLDFESRQDLYARIDQRAAQMMAQGLLDEVCRLLAQGISPRATAMQAIGYKECLATLDGAMTEAEALAQICQASRRYAKRQLTWFRRNPAVHWILQTAAPDAEKTFSQALQIVSAFDKP